MSCKYCDGCGGEKTYANQVCMPINGRVVTIDRCIHDIVAALNAGGIRTVSSCCGHKETYGSIIIKGKDDNLEELRILDWKG